MGVVKGRQVLTVVMSYAYGYVFSVTCCKKIWIQQKVGLLLISMCPGTGNCYIY